MTCHLLCAYVYTCTHAHNFFLCQTEYCRGGDGISCYAAVCGFVDFAAHPLCVCTHMHAHICMMNTDTWYDNFADWSEYDTIAVTATCLVGGHRLESIAAVTLSQLYSLWYSELTCREIMLCVAPTVIYILPQVSGFKEQHVGISCVS